MAKRESTFGSMLIVLSAVALVAAGLLGSVYALTKEPIRLAELEKKNNAIMAVVPEFNNVPSEEFVKYGVAGDSLTLYTAKMDGALVGTAVETFTNSGFSGEIKLMVGFAPDGSIVDVAVVKHAETPGLGDKMEAAKSDFHVQFMGQNPEEFKLLVTKDKGDVDAITASTISSRAYCEAVQRAYDAYKATNSAN
jgi:electron transport complex protein RnfG